MSDYDDNNYQQNTPEEQQNGSVNQPTDESGASQSSQGIPSENKNPYSSNGYGFGTPYYGNGAPQSGTTPAQGNPTQQNSTQYHGYTPAGRTSYVYYGSTSSQTPYSAQQYSRPAQPRVSKGNKTGKRIFFACLALLAVCAVLISGIAIGRGSGSSSDRKLAGDAPMLEIPSDSSDENTSQTKDGTGLKYSASSEELDPRDIYQKVKDASVGVLINYNGVNRSTSGEGSGIIVGEDESGKYTYIITCAHVVADGGTISVQLSDESQYEASLVGSDARTDIAVLRIAKTGLTAIEIGDSESLEVGETVYAIGNPGGVDFAGSFTNGMISAIARPISSEIGYQMVCIQHTAAINPGNSGGALVNSKGQLIGINSSKIASTDYEGMGFSVPSSTFVKVYNEIVSHGYVTDRPKLGIRFTPAMSNQTYAMLVSANNLPTGSLIIASIDADGALANSQAQPGDLIIAVNGKDFESADDLPDLIEKSKVGDKFTLTLCRFDNNYKMTKFDVIVTLVEDRGTSSYQQETTTQSQQYYFDPFEFFGYGNGNGN